jgi:hypothetical protein
MMRAGVHIFNCFPFGEGLRPFDVLRVLTIGLLVVLCLKSLGAKALRVVGQYCLVARYEGWYVSVGWATREFFEGSGTTKRSFIGSSIPESCATLATVPFTQL